MQKESDSDNVLDFDNLLTRPLGHDVDDDGGGDDDDDDDDEEEEWEGEVKERKLEERNGR